LQRINLLQSARRIDAPVYLFEGRLDHQVSATLAARWLDQLQAPRKELVWFEHSGHELNAEEPERMQQMLIKKVRPETYRPTAEASRRARGGS
jgi:proline iminopeptidase